MAFSLLHSLYKASTFIPLRESLNTSDQQVYNRYGNYPISKITIGRTPLKSFLGTALNALSLGQWQKAVKRYGYDKLFHLFLIIDISLPGNVTRQLILEKNESVRLYIAPRALASGTETMVLPMPYSGNVRSLFETTMQEEGPDRFWVYDAIHNNCQNFLLHVLGDNHILDNKAKDFIDQGVQQIARDQPSYLHPLLKGITDTSRRLKSLVGLGLDLPPGAVRP